MRSVILGSILWALACGAPDAESPPQEEAPQIGLRVFLEEVKPGGGVLVVQAEYDERGQVTLPDPSGDRLSFEPDGPPLMEEIGQRDVLTQRWVFRGPKGSYEIPPLTAVWTHDLEKVEAKSRSLFVDLDTPPPREGEIVDIVEPPAVWRPPLLAIFSVVALFLAGLLVAFRPRKVDQTPVAVVESPDVVAIREWEAIRADPSLSIDHKAREVARIFREYVEAVLGFEASSHTTSELLAHLSSLRHLPEGNVPRARRVLRAADRVKFAEDRPRNDIDGWLGELDSDLRAFVESTRPSAWREGGEA